MKDSFQDFTNNTEKRYMAVITYFLGISFFEDGTNMSKFPLSRDFTGAKWIGEKISLKD